jgi:hypothetical protein
LTDSIEGVIMSEIVDDQTPTKPSPWNSLEIVKVILGGLTPLVIFVLGYLLNESIRSSEKAQKDAELQRQRTEARQVAVQNLSRYIYERRARAELLLSSLYRNVSLGEIVERKRLYDDVYVKWNANHQANLLLIRQLLNEKEYSEFEALLEFHLVKNIFTPLDRCLTAAYDRRLTSGNVAVVLNGCGATRLVQAALDCRYALTDELYKLSSVSADSTSQSVASSLIAERYR